MRARLRGAARSCPLSDLVNVLTESVAPRAAPGVTVVSRVPIPAPCVVVWVLERPDRIGFGYGTTAGHPFSGEESFTASVAAWHGWCTG